MIFWLSNLWWRSLRDNPVPGAWSVHEMAGTILRTAQAQHSLLLDESRELAERHCRRQQQSIQALVTLTDRLQDEHAPAQASAAWLNWGRAGMDRLVEDASDQMQFASKAAQCCVDAWAAPFLTLRDNGKATSEHSVPIEYPDAKLAPATGTSTTGQLRTAENSKSKDAA